MADRPGTEEAWSEAFTDRVLHSAGRWPFAWFLLLWFALLLLWLAAQLLLGVNWIEHRLHPPPPSAIPYDEVRDDPRLQPRIAYDVGKRDPAFTIQGTLQWMPHGDAERLVMTTIQRTSVGWPARLIHITRFVAWDVESEHEPYTLAARTFSPSNRNAAGVGLLAHMRTKADRAIFVRTTVEPRPVNRMLLGMMAVACLAVAVPAVTCRVRQHRWRRRGMCLRCGHALGPMPQPQRCPECGNEIAPTMNDHDPRCARPQYEDHSPGMTTFICCSLAVLAVVTACFILTRDSQPTSNLQVHIEEMQEFMLRRADPSPTQSGVSYGTTSVGWPWTAVQVTHLQTLEFDGLKTPRSAPVIRRELRTDDFGPGNVFRQVHHRHDDTRKSIVRLMSHLMFLYVQLALVTAGAILLLLWVARPSRRTWRRINASCIIIALGASGVACLSLTLGRGQFPLPADVIASPSETRKDSPTAATPDDKPASAARIVYRPESNDHAALLIEYVLDGLSAHDAADRVLRDLLRDDPDLLRGSRAQLGVNLIVLRNNDDLDDAQPIVTYLNMLCIERMKEADCLPRCEDGDKLWIDLTVAEDHPLREHVHNARVEVFGRLFIDERFIPDGPLRCENFIELDPVDCDSITTGCSAISNGHQSIP